MMTIYQVGIVPDLGLGSLLARSWRIFKAKFGLCLGGMGVYLLIQLLLSIGPKDSWIDSTLRIVSFVVSGPLSAGLYIFYLRIVRGEEANVTMLFEGFSEFRKAFCVSFLMFLFILIGMFLLVIPGIILSVGLFPAIFLILDADYSIKGTLRKAWDMTRGFRWPIFVACLFLIFLNLIGLAALGVGVVFTGAYSMLVSALIYQELFQTDRSL